MNSNSPITGGRVATCDRRRWAVQSGPALTITDAPAWAKDSSLPVGHARRGLRAHLRRSTGRTAADGIICVIRGHRRFASQARQQSAYSLRIVRGAGNAVTLLAQMTGVENPNRAGYRGACLGLKVDPTFRDRALDRIESVDHRQPIGELRSGKAFQAFGA